MSTSDLGEVLIQKYLDELAAENDLLELNRLLAESPEAADNFARISRTDALLDEYFTDQQNLTRARAILDTQESIPAPRTRPSPFTPGPWRWVAAAVLFLATGSGLFYLLENHAAASYALVSGRVMVNGLESRWVREGAEVEVVGDEAAVIRLADGSLAELAPSTLATIRRGLDRRIQVVELSRGSGEFQVEEGHRHLQVKTPVGKVIGPGSEFSVELRPNDREEKQTIKRRLAMALIVGVMAGNVVVQYENNDYAIGIGDSRVYAGGKRAGKRNPDWNGRVTAVDAEQQSFTLELFSRANKKPLPTKTIQLTTSTRLSYVNVPSGAEKPAVGYRASVWLADASGDKASAVTFSTKKPQEPKPDLTGRVTAVSSDGKEVTLQLSPKKKGEPATTAVIKIGAKTKLTYGAVAMDGEKPSVGYFAAVWLGKAPGDDAAAVVFKGKNGGSKGADVEGPVTAVSDNGSEITVQVPPGKKNRAGTARTIKVGTATKVVYAGIDMARQKPTVGYFASVWLEKESSDKAAGIKFTLTSAKAGATGKTPAARAEAALAGFFPVPKQIDLTPDQKTRVDSVRKELESDFKKLQEKKNNVLSPEQKAAQSLAASAARQAGITDKRQINEAVETAVNVTPEQKDQMKALVTEEKQLRKRFFERLQSILTDEQKSQQSKPKAGSKTPPKSQKGS